MKTQTFILLLAFVLVGNLLAAQSKYEYAYIGSTGGDSVKYNWVKVVGRDDERKMDKLEVQQIDKAQFTNGTQGLIKKFEKGGWELFNHKEPWIYMRRKKYNQ